MCTKTEVPVFGDCLTREAFAEKVHLHRRPVVLRGIDLGRAPRVWSPNYLARTCGDKRVKVHVCPVDDMAFLQKNFQYKTLTFGELVQRASKDTQEEYFICPEEKYYLRAVGTDSRKDVADVEVQFPELMEDLSLPRFFGEDKFFSSVLRVGSPGVRLWTHYDIMDNLLVQISGRKRVVLFPPCDASILYLRGDKSQVVDIDKPDLKQFPLFAQAHACEALLQPGDVLFIPALWFHNVQALEFSVAVNTFWRHLDDAVYDKKDVYGNKDLLPAQRAFQCVDKAIGSLAELPDEYREFYARRLVNNIKSQLYLDSDADPLKL